MGVTALEVGPIACCCYIVSPDSGEEPRPCVVIDPGGDTEIISAEVKRLGLRVETVLLTHAHVDHIGGVDELLALWPGAVLACSAETSRRAGDPKLNLSVFMGAPVTAGPAARIIADGDEFEAAGMKWKAVEIPGHDPGEMVYILDGGMTVFTGDTLFEGSIGRSDFPGGDGAALVAGVKALLATLPPDATIYPGHGGETTARIERDYNPFLR
jgi:Zn-dependent hydrolases, including glyoxylases